MFDIGMMELLVVGIVALLVVGPKELPALLRTLGKYFGIMKRQANEFKAQFDEAIRESEFADIKKDIDEIRSDADESIREADAKMRKDFEEYDQDFEDDGAEWNDDDDDEVAVKPADHKDAAAREDVEPDSPAANGSEHAGAAKPADATQPDSVPAGQRSVSPEPEPGIAGHAGREHAAGGSEPAAPAERKSGA